MIWLICLNRVVTVISEYNHKGKMNRNFFESCLFCIVPFNIVLGGGTDKEHCEECVEEGRKEVCDIYSNSLSYTWWYLSSLNRIYPICQPLKGSVSLKKWLVES